MSLGPRTRTLLKHDLYSASTSRLPLDVEQCPVRVDPGRWRLGVPVGDVVFRRYHSFDDPIWRTGAMAANAERAPASIGILDEQDGIAIGPFVLIADLVDDTAGSL